ncbi:threonine/serine exporter family protein [Miniphocaeibacter massiliensis]|uniref:threonine/serine exporter family protein n=1 Tax=Miniphocaeibacter massiliensis TaxID=2041841 RepID=UPI000C085656|nr:threonine/serine exporter family protein [Miniphocaeibacter massiliensis]
MIFKSICSGLASVCFGMFFNSPKKSYYGNFITGTIGMLSFYVAMYLVNTKFIALIISSLIIGFISEILAKVTKYPATVYLISGLLPQVPGLAIFKTMQGIAMQNFDGVFRNGLDAIVSSTALALGIVISTIFSRSINRARKEGIKIPLKYRHNRKQRKR